MLPKPGKADCQPKQASRSEAVLRTKNPASKTPRVVPSEQRESESAA